MHEHVSMSLLKVLLISKYLIPFLNYFIVSKTEDLAPLSQFQEAGVPTPKFGLAKTAAEAKKIAEDIAGNDLVHSYIDTYIQLLRINHIHDSTDFHHSKGETC